MTEYRFNFSMADQVRDHMASINNEIHSMLSTLDGDVRKSLASWESGAREAYDAAKLQWDAAAGRMPASLGRAEQALSAISDGYLQVEHFGIDQWTQ